MHFLMDGKEQNNFTLTPSVFHTLCERKVTCGRGNVSTEVLTSNGDCCGLRGLIMFNFLCKMSFWNTMGVMNSIW